MTARTRLGLPVLLITHAAAIGAGYYFAPREILDSEIEHAGLFQVDTKKVLAATVESLRSAIGAMINNGVSLHVAGKVAGHLRSESTARYAYVSDVSLAAAVEAGADNLMLGGAR